MKKVLLFIAILFSISGSNAQSISMEAISSGGDTYTRPSSRLSFTDGLVMSGTYASGTNTLMEGFQQQYFTYWIGMASNAWNNLLNWCGGPVPGAHTDVIILPGKPNYPLLSLNASCRSLRLRPATTVTISPGFKLTITN